MDIPAKYHRTFAIPKWNGLHGLLQSGPDRIENLRRGGDGK